MHIKSLKVFCDVVRRRSFSRAARENELSQSGASQLVQQLEERLGVKLIDRSKRPFVLTPEGEVFYDGCRSLVERYDVLEERVRKLHEVVEGRVRVASIYSVGLHHMSRHIQEFLTRHPKSNVRLEYLHPHRVYEAVEGDTADLGIVSYPKASRTMRAIRWRIEPMALVCSPRHRLAGRDRVSLDELHGENVVNFDSDLTIRREIDAVLQAHGVEVRVAMEFDNIETIKRAIEIDAGIGLLPIPTVMREAEAGTLVVVPLATDELVRPLGIIFRRGKEQSSTTRRFMELLQAQEGENVAALELPAGAAVDATNGELETADNGASNGAHHDTHHDLQNGNSARSADGESACSANGAGGAEHLVPVAVAGDNGSS